MNRDKAKSDLIWIGLFFALGVFVILSSSSIRVMAALEGRQFINSRFVPRLVGFLMCILSSIWFIKDFLLGKAADTGSEKKASGALFPFFCTIGAGVLYIFIFEPLGFLVSSWAYLIGVCLILKIRSKKTLVLLPVLTSLGVFYFFRLLGVPLPMGILGFLQ